MIIEYNEKYPVPDNYKPKNVTITGALYNLCTHQTAQKCMFMAGQWWWLCHCGSLLYENRQYACEFRNLSLAIDNVIAQA